MEKRRAPGSFCLLPSAFCLLPYDCPRGTADALLAGGGRHDRSHCCYRRNAPADRSRKQTPRRTSTGSREASEPLNDVRLKSTTYNECYEAIVAIWREEGGQTLDDIALMATINSVLANSFPQFFWTGFYRVCGERLIVGPYIGTVGCLQIEFGRGVCGTSAARRETIIVPDVNQFPGHIACDAQSKSEIVVPVFDRDGELIAVLDVDSDQLDAFDEDDRAGLERIVALFAA
jgi:L-methionine (R)-S-oxide reductase